MDNSIVLCVGHNKTAKGAYNKNYDLSEYTLNKLFITIISKRLILMKYPVSVIDDAKLAHKVSLINKLLPVMAIDLHFNAFDGTKIGNLFMYQKGKSSSRLIGATIQKEATYNKQLDSIEVETPQHNYFVAATKIPAIVYEVGFMDNENDLLPIIINTNAICEMFVKGISKAYNLLK